jgi:hypothetical protein
MAVLVDNGSGKLIDFFYNRAELVSRAFFDAAMVSISHPRPSWVNLVLSGQRNEVEKCPTGAKFFWRFCKESRQ